MKKLFRNLLIISLFLISTTCFADNSKRFLKWCDKNYHRSAKCPKHRKLRIRQDELKRDKERHKRWCISIEFENVSCSDVRNEIIVEKLKNGFSSLKSRLESGIISIYNTYKFSMSPDKYLSKFRVESVDDSIREEEISVDHQNPWPEFWDVEAKVPSPQ